jgi:hypothetical protein
MVDLRTRADFTTARRLENKSNVLHASSIQYVNTFESSSEVAWQGNRIEHSRGYFSPSLAPASNEPLDGTLKPMTISRISRCLKGRCRRDSVPNLYDHGFDNGAEQRVFAAHERAQQRTRSRLSNHLYKGERFSVLRPVAQRGGRWRTLADSSDAEECRCT